MQESKSSQVEVFLNSVPILTSLSREEKLKLANALEEHTFEPQEHIIEEVCCPLQVRKACQECASTSRARIIPISLTLTERVMRIAELLRQ